MSAEPIPSMGPVPDAAGERPAEPSPEPEIPADLAEIFAAEAHDHLQAISAAVDRVCEGHDAAPHLRELRRSLHTLKGAAGMVGFRSVSHLAHHMEDLLDEWHDQQSPPEAGAAHLLRRSADLLADLVDGGRSAAVAARLAEVEEAYELRRPPTGVPAGKAPSDSAASVAADAGQVSLGAAPAAAPAAPDLDPTAASSAGRGRALRVPIARLDDAVRELGELIVIDSGLEQHVGRLRAQVDEMTLAVARIGRLAARLENEYQVLTLGGNLARRFGTQAPVGLPAESKARPEFDELELESLHRLPPDFAGTEGDLERRRHHRQTACRGVGRLRRRPGAPRERHHGSPAPPPRPAAGSLVHAGPAPGTHRARDGRPAGQAGGPAARGLRAARRRRSRGCARRLAVAPAAQRRGPRDRGAGGSSSRRQARHGARQRGRQPAG